MSRGNGSSALGLRKPDPVEVRSIELALPRSAWERLLEDATVVGIDVDTAVAQLIGDLCSQANNPPPAAPAVPRQRKARASRTTE